MSVKKEKTLPSSGSSEKLINPQQFANVLKKRREKLGISIRGLAEKANVAQSTIFRLEKGDYHVQFDTLLKVLTVLQLSPNDLVASVDDQENILISIQEQLTEVLNDPKVQDALIKLSDIIRSMRKTKGKR